MRPALAVAFAVCLTMTAAPAFAADIPMGPQLVEVPAATVSTPFQQQSQVAPELYSRVEFGSVGHPKGALGGGGKVVAKSWMLDFRPFDNGFRLSIGARKDRLGSSGRLGRDTLNTGGLGGSGYKRHLTPSAMIGYDGVVDANNRFSLEGGVRKGGHDSMTSQLIRLADLGGDSRRLAAPAGRFAPAVRASFIHSF